MTAPKYGPPYLKDLTRIAAWAVAMTVIFAFICTVAANAAPLKGHHAHRHHAVRTHSHRQPVRVAVPRAESHWWGGGGSSVVAEARSQIGNGAIYGRSNLWCARFVNYVLKATGHSGTNSDQAASFARYGTRISGPQVGAIAVMSRRGGGHVGIVSGLDASGNPILISGNNQHRVREAVYPRGRIYAYVLPPT